MNISLNNFVDKIGSNPNSELIPVCLFCEYCKCTRKIENWKLCYHNPVRCKLDVIGKIDFNGFGYCDYFKMRKHK
jgi:hypothetical protein